MDKFILFIKHLLGWIKAIHRGETRVAPLSNRGRIYKAKGKVKISARVLRANGTVEDLGVIGKIEE